MQTSFKIIKENKPFPLFNYPFTSDQHLGNIYTKPPKCVDIIHRTS